MMSVASLNCEGNAFRISKAPKASSNSLPDLKANGLSKDFSGVEALLQPRRQKNNFLSKYLQSMKSSDSPISPEYPCQSRLSHNFDKIFRFEEEDGNARSLAGLRSRGVSFSQPKLSDSGRMALTLKRLGWRKRMPVKVTILLKLRSSPLLLEETLPAAELLNLILKSYLPFPKGSSQSLKDILFHQALNFAEKLNSHALSVSAADSAALLNLVGNSFGGERDAREMQEEERKARELLTSAAALHPVTIAREKQFVFNFLFERASSLMKKHRARERDAGQHDVPSDSLPNVPSLLVCSRNVLSEAELGERATFEASFTDARGKSHSTAKPPPSQVSTGSLPREEKQSQVEQVRSYLALYRRRESSQGDYEKFVKFGHPAAGAAGLSRFVMRAHRHSLKTPGRTLRDTLELMRNYIAL